MIWDNKQKVGWYMTFVRLKITLSVKDKIVLTLHAYSYKLATLAKPALELKS